MSPENPPLTIPRLIFTHAGIERTLNKHTAVVTAYKRGEITLEAFRAKPWYLRVKLPGKQERPFKLSANDKDALRAAKDILNGTARPDGSFSEWLAERDARKGVTVATLAAEWIAAGLPFSKTNPRTAAEAEPLQGHLTRALRWAGWGKAATQVTTHDHDDFVVWRRAHTKRGRAAGPTGVPGSRSADLELSALSSLCQWAQRVGKLDKNPFEERERYHAPEAVEHCHQFMPQSDEQFHRVLTWFWTVEYNSEELSNRHSALALLHYTRVAGAWLAWTGLVGLRPEEPAYLYRYPRHVQTPGHLRDIPAGTVFPTRDGQLTMKVRRSKRGQNPFVRLHPAALAFLDSWERWLDVHLPGPFGPQLARPLFPDPEGITTPLCSVGDTTLLNKRLDQAVAGLQLGVELKPKGFGRAYYVRVRRSQGVDDATIAGELGQTTNGKLIRTTYGDPEDMVGGAAFDWLPEDEKHKAIDPAWSLLTQAAAAVPSNVIALPAAG